MNKGTVYLDLDYVFPNGNRKDKYCIVLDSQPEADQVLIVITTSQSKNFQGTIQGCNLDKNVYLFEKSNYFNKPTYIPLRIHKIKYTYLINKKLHEGKIKKFKNLDQADFAALLNCISRSKRVERKYKDQIFRNSEQ